MGNVPAEACIALGKGLSDVYCAQDLLHEINALHTDTSVIRNRVRAGFQIFQKSNVGFMICPG
jgi:hypothetical protein